MLIVDDCFLCYNVMYWCYSFYDLSMNYGVDEELYVMIKSVIVVCVSVSVIVSNVEMMYVIYMEGLVYNQQEVKMLFSLVVSNINYCFGCC